MVKKFLPLLLCILFAVDQVVIPSNTVFSQADAYYQEEVELLQALNIIDVKEGQTIKPDYLVTRAEFVDAVIRMTGIEAGVSSPADVAVFEDVPLEHYLAASIQTAQMLGIVSVPDDKHFRPNASITMLEATTMLLNMLGYQPMYEANGGFPNGVLDAAGRLGLQKHMGDSTAYLDRSTMIKLLSDTLEIKKMKTTYGTEPKNTIGEKTVLDDLNVFKVRGKINGNSLSGMGNSAKTQADSIRIGDTVYAVDHESNYRRLLGIEAELYIQKSSTDLDNERVIYMRKINTEEEVIHFTQINGCEETEDYVTISYEAENSNKLLQVKIPQTSKVIYNLVYDEGDLSDTISDCLITRNGQMTLISSKGVENEVVYIDTFYAGVVDTYSPDTQNIVFKNNISPLHTDTANHRMVEATKNDNRIDLTELKPYDIANIYQSKDDSVVRIVVSDETLPQDSYATNSTIRGAISDITETDGYGTLTINGNTYITSKQLWQEKGALLKINTGINAVFYLDIENKVVFVMFENDEASYRYGYLIGAGKQSGSHDMAVKILDQSGSVMVLNCSESLTVKGYNLSGEMVSKRIKTPEALRAYFMSQRNTSAIERQLIKYSVNNEYNINRIITAKNDFVFAGVPVTDYNPNNGGKKKFMSRPPFKDNEGTVYYGYTPQELYVQEYKEDIAPVNVDVTTYGSGYLPLSVLADQNRGDVTPAVLMRNYTNYDVGKYTNLPSFSFYKVSGSGSAYTDMDGQPIPNTDPAENARGIVRNVHYVYNASDTRDYYVFNSTKAVKQKYITNAGDITDSLSNLPGKISKITTDYYNPESDAALIDSRYVLNQETTIFHIPGEVDTNGLIYDSLTGNDEDYYIGSTSSLAPGSVQMMQLFDIDNNNLVSAMVLVDRDSLDTQNVERYKKPYLTYPAIVRGNVVETMQDGEKRYKIPVFINGKEDDLYIKEDVRDNGLIMRYYDKSTDELVGQYANKFSYTVPAPVNEDLTVSSLALPSYTTAGASPNGVKGFYEGLHPKELKIGSVFLYFLDNDNTIGQFCTLFNYGKAGENYYEATGMVTTYDKFLNNTEEIALKGALSSSRTNQGLSNVGSMIYGEVAALGKATASYFYMVVNSKLPMLTYYDRVTSSAPYQLVISDYDNHIVPVNIQRIYKYTKTTPIWIVEIVNGQPKNIRKASNTELVVGDKVFYKDTYSFIVLR